MMTNASDVAITGSQALKGIRVLDLSGMLGNYCGKLFADLGADVILVEPLGGTENRHRTPKLKWRSDPDASLMFQYNNTNKRSIVLDLERAEGQEVLRSFVKRAHLLIETERPGVMDARGLGFKTLREIAPHFVMTSITPFGQSGPYTQWQAQDIVGLALGGLLYLGGYPDGPPMAAFGNQAHVAANLFAAVASMAALYEAEISNSGQHIDVSMQECVIMAMENAVQFYDLEGTIRKRTAGKHRLAGTGVFECEDGYVYLIAGGVSAPKFWRNTTQWLIDEGVEGAEFLKDSRWSKQDYLLSDEGKENFKRIFSRFAKNETKLNLYTRGQQHRVPIAPVCNTAEIVRNKQLQERGFFVTLEPSAGESEEKLLVMPGAPYRLSATPWSLQRRAPKLGEHTGEILSMAGITDEQQAELRQKGIVQ
jgi:benzylsuccinate CoA-transferase BbsE subunit